MQSSSIPAKYLVPFAQNDSAKVEIPVTTADTTRASQSLGFPPRTMLPPEASGVPPQGEDFNGAMNQIARAAWWMLQGNGFPFDDTFATDTNIGGYAKGASIPRADLTGYWLNGADNNATNPEATDGTAANWLPGYNYGTYTVSGFAGANITLYPVQAARDTLILTGTLTASVQLIVPAWLKAWTVVNNVTLGAFTITMKTASGTGVVLASGSQRVRGDGTNVTQVAESIAPATIATQALQMGQVSGVVGAARGASMYVGTASSSGTWTAAEIIVETALGGLRYCLANFSQTINLATTGAGGMDTGSAPTSGYVAIYAIYNPTTGTRSMLAQNATSSAATEVYTGAFMPAGYTASALASVWPTTSGGLLAVAKQRDRRVSTPLLSIYTTSAAIPTYTSFSIASVLPPNTKTLFGGLIISSNTAGAVISIQIAGDASAIGAQGNGAYMPLATATLTTQIEIDVITTGVLYVTTSASTGTPTFTLTRTGYLF